MAIARVIAVESSRCISLIRVSLTMTRGAAAASWAVRAAIAARIASSTSEPIRRTWSLTALLAIERRPRRVGRGSRRSRRRSSSASRMISLIWRVTATWRGVVAWPSRGSPSQPNRPDDVVLGQLFFGLVKIDRVAHLDEVAGAVVAHREERGPVADAGRLLHVVGHDDDRVVLAQLGHQLLDAEGRDGIERRRRLVHEDHLRVDRERPGDAQPLLLPARERRARSP